MKFKSSMLKSSLCDYSDAYIIVSGIIKTDGAGADDNAKRLDEINKRVILKKHLFTPFIHCKINNTQIDNAKDLDVGMPMYNLIEYSNNYLKTSGSLRQYCGDDPNYVITNSESFKFKIKRTGKTRATSNTKEVEIVGTLKYFSIFCRTLEIPLINCEINLILDWSPNYVISSATEKKEFTITDTKFYVSMVTLSTPENAKLL